MDKFTKVTEERVIPGLPEQKNLFEEHLARYRFAQKYANDKTVLDTGCGCGYGTYDLIQKGAKSVVGIDVSDTAVEYCKTHCQARNLTFRVMDCTELSFRNDSFDVVVSFELIEHLKNPEGFLGEVKRILKNDGVFIISTPNIKDKSPLKSGFHFREYDAETLRYLLKEHFSEVTLYGQRYSSLVLEETRKKEERVERVPKIFSRFFPVGLKKFIFSKFINRYFLSLEPKDIIFTKEDFREARNIIGVCYKRD